MFQINGNKPEFVTKKKGNLFSNLEKLFMMLNYIIDIMIAEIYAMPIMQCPSCLKSLHYTVNKFASLFFQLFDLNKSIKNFFGYATFCKICLH